MPDHRRKRKPNLDSPLPPSPLSQAKWTAIVPVLELSPQLANVTDLVLRDLCDKQIADRLGLSLYTVHTYMERIRLQLRVPGRTGIILKVFAIAEGMNGGDGCPDQ